MIRVRIGNFHAKESGKMGHLNLHHWHAKIKPQKFTEKSFYNIDLWTTVPHVPFAIILSLSNFCFRLHSSLGLVPNPEPRSTPEAVFSGRRGHRLDEHPHGRGAHRPAAERRLHHPDLDRCYGKLFSTLFARDCFALLLVPNPAVLGLFPGIHFFFWVVK